MQFYLPIIGFIIWASRVDSYKDPNFAENRTTIVHLFEWKWEDIAIECERFLGPRGFGGVQISPPNENLVMRHRPYEERYQPVSYILKTRSGDEAELKNMINRCNKANVRIYADVVISHMAADQGYGTAGSLSDPVNLNFPAVPYTKEHFLNICSVDNEEHDEEVDNCKVKNQKDLNHGSLYVRKKIQDYMNHLIRFGVAGFRIDNAKVMLPKQLGKIYAGLEDTVFGTKPYIYQELFHLGNELIPTPEFVDIGDVLEFDYGLKLGKIFNGRLELRELENWGPDWGLVQSEDAVVFLDSHETQRIELPNILTYKDNNLYRMANAFMLAHPYGTPRIMSSYWFELGGEKPPPQDINEKLITPKLNEQGICINGWICEHRWNEIANMVKFRNSVIGTKITDWWSTEHQQIAFGREDKGFILISLYKPVHQEFRTSLPDGDYCDIFNGNKRGNSCTGPTLRVFNNTVYIDLVPESDRGVVAIHVGAKLKTL